MNAGVVLQTVSTGKTYVSAPKCQRKNKRHAKNCAEAVAKRQATVYGWYAKGLKPKKN